MDVAKDVAERLVKERLAACINIIDGVLSIYWWNGRVEEASESLLLIKTRSELFEKLKKRIVEVHPYETPEVVALKIEDGLKEYLEWIDESLGANI